MATALGTYNFSDQDNFFRMNILIIEFALKVLQDILREELTKKYPNLFDPSTGLLCLVLGDATVQAKLLRLSPKLFNHHQRNQLYPAGKPSTYVTVADLDITLTVLLLRNITTLNPRPGLNAWDNPSDADTSREAKIGRVKRYRNIIYGNANKAAISDQDFRAHFTELKSILLGLSGKFTNEDYDAILSKPLDAELFKKLRYYEKYVNEIMKPGFEEISQVQPELKKQVEDVQTTKDFREQFHRLCASGSIPVYRQRVAIVGPYGVGKTHLVKRLIQEKYEKDNDANTPGVKIYRHRCIVHKGDKSCWIRGKDNPEDQFVQKIAMGIQKPETSRYPVELEETPSAESLTDVKEIFNGTRRAPPTGDSGLYTSPDRAAAATPGDSGSHASPVRTVDYLKNIDPELLGKIEKIARGERVEPEKQVTIWDFGGQDVYYTTHQTFLSEHIIYLLVFRLDVDLDEKIPVYRGEKTVKEFIMFWLNSIHMHTTGKLRKGDKYVTPYVLLIGTHKDMLGPQDDGEKIFRKLMEYIKDNEELNKHVYKYFAISNLAKDEEFDGIKRAIEDLCGYSSASEAMVHNCSVSWIQLEMDLAKKREGSPIITVKQLCEMAQKVGLSDGELQDNFIPYHHRQGDILHFKVDGLKDVVIIDPLWLADVFSAIMTPASIRSGCSHGDLLKEDLERGVLKEEVFDEYLKEKKMTERKTEIIQLMLYFDLMLEVPQSAQSPPPESGKKIFFVPSMLVSDNNANDGFSETDPQNYLLIAFHHIMFPTGLFHRLIIRVLKKYRALQYKYRIPVVGFDRASFRLEDKKSVLHLAIEEKAMKINIINGEKKGNTITPEPRIYSTARETVEKALSAVRKAYCPRMHFGYYIRDKNAGVDISIEVKDNQIGDEICHFVQDSDIWIDLRPYHIWFSGNQDRRAFRCPEDEYKNDSEPRGRALIINNKTFSKGWLKARYGSEADVDALKKLFGYLHYETHVISDLTNYKMKKEIEKESQRDDHKEYDSFVLFLMSHGTKSGVYGKDGRRLAYDTIRKKLNNKNCPGLRGKPKMIFIQACQGNIEDSGVLLDGQTVQQPQQSPPATNLDKEIPDAPHEILQPSDFTTKLPTMTDFLEVHSTSPDYVSYRHPTEGTWFVQTIVDIFYRHAHECDVLCMLGKVSDAISKKQTPTGKKQASVAVSSLRKKLFFNTTRGKQKGVRSSRVTMPPKPNPKESRRSRTSNASNPSSSSSKRRLATESTAAGGKKPRRTAAPSSETESTFTSPVIDYDLLAQRVIAHQTATSTAMPSASTSSGSSLQRSTPDTQNQQSGRQYFLRRTRVSPRSKPGTAADKFHAQ